MYPIRLTVLFTLLARVALAAQPQTAQSPVDAHPVAPPTEAPVVVQVQGGNANVVARTLSSVFPGLIISAVGDSPVLVLRGADEEVALAQTLVGEITQQGRAVDSTVVRLFRLAHVRPQDITTQLQVAFSRHDISVAPDIQRGSLLVRGRPDVLETVADIISDLDTTGPADMTANVSLEFSYLTAGPDKSDAGLDLPADLAEVGKELARFGTIKLMGRLKTVTTKDQPFEIEGMIADKFNVRVKGRLMSASGDGALVELEAMAIAFRAPPASDAPGLGGPPVSPPKSSAYNMRTTLQLKPNDHLAVGIAPAGAHVGSSLVLVVRASW